MDGKKGVIFVLDVGDSMVPHLAEAKRVITTEMQFLLTQSKTHEVGVVLYGVPDEETDIPLFTREAEDLNEDGSYNGVREFIQIDRTSIAMMRELEGVRANPGVRSDPFSALIVAMDQIYKRTKRKKYDRHVYLLTDARSMVEKDCDEIQSDLENVVAVYAKEDTPTQLHVVFLGLPTEPQAAGTAGAASGTAAADAVDDTVDAADVDAANAAEAVVAAAAADVDAANAAEAVVAAAAAGGDDNEVQSDNVRMYASLVRHVGGSVESAQQALRSVDARPRSKKPLATVVPLRVGTSLRVQCRMFKKTDKFKLPPVKKENRKAYDPEKGSENLENGSVKREKSYRDPDVPEKEFDLEERVKGVRYGRTYQLIDAVNEEAMKYGVEEPCVDVLGFVPRDRVPRHAFMDNTYILQAPFGSEASERAISALKRALAAESRVAIARLASRSGNDPQLAVLLPDNTGAVPYDRLLVQVLPFMDDVRPYTFPSFDNPPSSRRPTETQLGAAAALVDALQLPHNRLFEGNSSAGPGAPHDPVRDGLPINPVERQAEAAVLLRALRPTAPLPEADKGLMAVLAPRPSVVGRAAAAAAVRSFGAAFSFEPREDKKKKRKFFWSDFEVAEEEEEQPPQTTDSGGGGGGAPGGTAPTANGMTGDGEEAGEGEATGLKVGSIDPVGDFERIVATGNEAALKRGAGELEALVHDMVGKAITAKQREKPVACFAALRLACVVRGRAALFNSFARGCKARCGDDASFADFWDEAIAAGMGLITVAEEPKEGETAAAAGEFLKPPAVAGVATLATQYAGSAEAMDDEDDDDLS